MLEVIIVGIGGFIGANIRFLLSKLLNNQTFPYATLLANVSAAFIIGIVLGLTNTSFDLTPRTKLLINTGILGGLSTFSTFSLETITLIQQERYVDGTLNILLNVALSLIAVLLGLSLAKTLTKTI